MELKCKHGWTDVAQISVYTKDIMGVGMLGGRGEGKEQGVRQSGSVQCPVEQYEEEEEYLV